MNDLRWSTGDAPRMGGDQAAALVRARLGRRAQDALEAAVVLEAWGGVRPATALRLGADLTAVAPASAPDRTGGDDEPRARWRLSEQVALVVALVALIAWSGPLITAYGSRAFETTWQLAVPLTLGVQYAIRRRYLAGPASLGRLRRDGLTLVTAAVLLPTLLAAAVGVGGGVAGLLVVLWVSASVVGQRGWGVWYGLLLSLVAVVLWRGWPATIVLVAATVTALGCAVAAVLSTEEAKRRPGPWHPVLLSALTGLGLGFMLVIDGGVRWNTDGLLPALILLPSVLAGLWAGAYLDRLWDAVPGALRDTTLRRPAQRRARRGALRIVGGATIRLFALAVVLSAAVATGPWRGEVDVVLVVGLLTGFGSVAIATLAITLTESFGRPRWALGAVAAGLACELAAGRLIAGLPAGVALAVGGAVTVSLALPAIVLLLRQPGRTLATVVNVQ